MNRISKPRIVDFLRLCDRNKWVHPRIRFASVRSKPELIDDIHHNFIVTVDKHLVTITPRSSCRRVPVIQYDLEARKYLVDGVYREFQKESRRKPEFQIRYVPTTIHFESFLLSKGSSARQKASGALLQSLAQGTGAPLAASS